MVYKTIKCIKLWQICFYCNNLLETHSLMEFSSWLFQVCDWLYPLVPDRSPVLKCTVGAYMFPDTMLQAAGCFVGVVLSSELPEDDRELFEDLLRQMSDLRLQVTQILGKLTLTWAPKMWFQRPVTCFREIFLLLHDIETKVVCCWLFRLWALELNSLCGSC